MKKKILHIVEAFGGGIFSFLVDLINNTSDEFEIYVAYGKREQTPNDFFSYFNYKVKFVEIKNFTRSINLKKDLKAYYELKKIIKEINPDVIHLHSSKAGFLGRFANKNKQRNVLYNPHGFSFLMKDKNFIKRWMYWGIEKVCTIKKATIIGCSYGEYEEAKKLTKDAKCINNGININEFDEIIRNLESDEIDFKKLRICTSGRIGIQKNPKLFNEIAMTFPKFEFTWIGDGELREELTSPNITITGWKTRGEVFEILQKNDIFILTSMWEGLPIALLEAMYLKKLCLVTNCIGNRDVINHNVNGYIITQNNYEEIIKSIDENEYSKKIKTAVEDVKKKFNFLKNINEYKKEYLKGEKE